MGASKVDIEKESRVYKVRYALNDSTGVKSFSVIGIT